MKIIFEYGWLIIIPFKAILLDFDFMFYVFLVLALLFLLSKLFLKFEVRIFYPEFFKDLDSNDKTIN